MTGWWMLAVALAAGCSKPAPAHEPDLARYLYHVAGEADRAQTIAGWKLSREEWERVVVEPYRPLYDDYARAFEAARVTLAGELATKRSILARAHFAGDSQATRSQAITRWALPTLAPTKIAELAGRPATPIDAVFVDVGGAWRAIVGVGAIVQRRIGALDASCAPVLERIEPAGGACIEAAWAVADAAVREDRARLSHACGLAANLCGKRSEQ